MKKKSKDGLWWASLGAEALVVVALCINGFFYFKNHWLLSSESWFCSGIYVCFLLSRRIFVIQSELIDDLLLEIDSMRKDGWE